MASISKLSIRGIRAFNPEDQEQIVEFYFPITIIVGQNGCGKTTIIEALRYAITGSFPPGSGRSGNAFVHDPKSIVQTTVKANVKLRFTSRAGQSMVVIRSMELTQKKTAQTFKQLDGVLRMMDPITGERVSLSHKCTELDKQIPQLLGISKPILEHVVFCHQEDASWPLMEGAILKKRFDEIFDSTKYTKALQIFRQTEKELISKVKDLKAEYNTYIAHKQASDAFRKEVTEQEEHVNSLRDAKKEVEKDIGKLDETIQRLEKVMAAVEKVDGELDLRRNDVLQLTVVAEKQKEMLEEDLTKKHSLNELKDMLRDFDQKMNAQLLQEQELSDRVEQIKNKIDITRKNEIQLTSTVGKLIAEKEAHEKNLRERFRKMERIAQTYSMELTQTGMSQGNVSFLSQTQGDRDEDDETMVSETSISISPEDMQCFFEALSAKKAQLQEKLNEVKSRYRSEEDKIQAYITEIGGKLQAIESDKFRLSEERKEAEREMKDLKEVAALRVRKTDVEDRKRTAARLAEERNQLNKDPRRLQITKEIRDLEDLMEKLRRKIDDETSILQSLKHTADAQSSLLTLREQCDKDVDFLDDTIREESYTLNKFDIFPPSQLPRDDDDDGDQLVNVIVDIMDKAREKYDVAESNLEKSTDEVVSTQKIIAEKSALLAGNQKSLALLKSKKSALTNSVLEIQKTVEELRRHEAQQGRKLTAIEDEPRHVIEYIDQRLQEVEDNVPESNPVRTSKRVAKRLRKLAKVNDPETNLVDVVCPCCKRRMNADEATIFQASIKDLEEKLALVDTNELAQEQYDTLKKTYQTMRKAIESRIDDIRDDRRLSVELNDLEHEIQRLQDDLLRHNDVLKELIDAKDEIQSEVKELREMVDTIRRWKDDANRIAEKRLQIRQKKLDLQGTIADTSRDLNSVDREITEMREEKESYSNKILRLNREMSSLNQKISEISTAASNAEKLLRDTEEKYAAELKVEERRKYLVSRIHQIGEEEKKLSEQVVPLLQKRKKKESEKESTRSLGVEEEEKHQVLLNQFNADVDILQKVTIQIDSHLNSEKNLELEQTSLKIAALVDQIKEKTQEMSELEPKLRAMKRAVDDQGRYKKLLEQNIEIFTANADMNVLKKTISDLERQRGNIKGGSTAKHELDEAKAQKVLLQQKKSNYEGRHSSHMDQVYALKRKLSSPEYKDVDVQHRVAHIKMVTTKLAAEDLKKYGNALDKALLQFHGVKIREINKIIKELWMMIYKGQDITDIEIQSGMEPGSKAAKSYNYRVVMRKGGATMDMRGRCSAGQRVLACIVIRLALAETFGVNCGVVALDEPTVNLDYDNKRGLAIALSHIVAARSQQRNFQLIMITHDEEFVGMMKVELSSMTGFSMPDRYFQVCREEGADGKFYSKIHAMDWDDLA